MGRVLDVLLRGIELDQAGRPFLALPRQALDFFASLFSLCLFPGI